MRAEAEMGSTDAAGGAGPRRLPWRRILTIAAVVLAALFFALAFTAFLVDQAVHRHLVLTWYDLNVYNDSGLITRQLPAILYTWQLKAGVQFTYTPFAALLFAGGSLIPWWTLRWIMVIASLATIPLTVWLTLGAMGRRGAGRVAVTLVIAALALWTEPMAKALFLGQIEPLLMLLVVWDLTRQDSRRWKGIGVGVAAGIKLVPLLFIPYFLLTGKVRQAAIATGSFIATVVIGFIALPGPSASYWLTGYFMRPGRTGSVHSLVNQSLLGALARLYGTNGAAQPAWLPVALGVAAGGLVGGAVLSRRGREVQGWTLVGITSVLVSPISWDHHWVWIIPVLALLGGLAMNARLVARAGYVLTIIVICGAMGSWPWDYSGPKAFVPRRGILGWFVKPPQVTEIKVVHGWQLLTWNLFVVVGILVYLGLIAAAIVAWRGRPRRRAADVTAQSPIDALLARADAVLRGGVLAAPNHAGSHARADFNSGFTGDARPDHVSGDLGAADGAVSERAESTGDVGAGQSASAPRPARLAPLRLRLRAPGGPGVTEAPAPGGSRSEGWRRRL